MEWGSEHGWPVFWLESTKPDRQRRRGRLEESHFRDDTRRPHDNLPEPLEKRRIEVCEPPVTSVFFLERWINARAFGSMEEREVEHCQAQNREHDSGYDETLSRARARWPVSIGGHANGGSIHYSTATR